MLKWENMSALVEDGEIRLGAATFGSATLSDEEPIPSTSSEESKPSTGAGDAGILVFVIPGILAVAGAAVVIKVRN